MPAAGFGGSARLVGAGRDCGDVASAGRVIVIAAFESPAVVAGLDDVAVVSQTVEQCSGHFGVAEHAGPFAEREIGGDALLDRSNSGVPLSDRAWLRASSLMSRAIFLNGARVHRCLSVQARQS